MNSLIVKALHFAADKHRDQRRKSSNAAPYVNHAIDVMHILAVEAEVEDAVILAAAALHDTIEDTEATAEELRGIFGDAIMDLVLEVTDDKSLPKDVRKRLQIEHAPLLTQEAKLIKLADKIANLRDVSLSPPAGWDEERIIAYGQWAYDVLAQLRGTHEKLEALFDAAYARRRS